MDEFEIYTPVLTTVEQKAMLLHTQQCFDTSLEFIKTMGIPLPDITDDDRKEALHIFHESPLAPSKPTTLGAARMLDSLLAKYDYQLIDPTTKMRNYVMFKLFELAESPDEKTSMRALENLAKTSEIGLFSDKVEININQKSTAELEENLARLVGNILHRRTPDVYDADSEMLVERSESWWEA